MRVTISSLRMAQAGPKAEFRDGLVCYATLSRSGSAQRLYAAPGESRVPILKSEHLVALLLACCE